MNTLKKYRGPIAAVLCIAAVLVLTFVWGEPLPDARERTAQSAETVPHDATALDSSAPLEAPEPSLALEPSPATDFSEPSAETAPDEPLSDVLNENVLTHDGADVTNPPDTPSDAVSEDAAAFPPAAQQQEPPVLSTETVENPTAAATEQPEHPLPMGENDAVFTDTALTCTLSVRCDTLLSNLDRLDPEKAELVPADGVLFAEQTVTFYDGESVFNLLVREMKKNRIHLEFENTPLYRSAYIEGIGNLYEYDCGELSGWLYRVNGWFPNYGCSRYRLREGDRVEFVYTCDLGADVGADSAKAGEQADE